MSINRLGSEEWPPDEIFKQIAINRDCDNNGMIFFSYSGLEIMEENLVEKGFRYLANMPPMSWKDDQPPLDPRNLHISFIPPGEVQLEWSSPDTSLEPTDILCYNIFRSEKSPVNFMDARNLIHITTSSDTAFFDSSVELGKTYYYVVTALDRVNNESPPSNELKVVVPQFVQADGNMDIHSD